MEAVVAEDEVLKSNATRLAAWMAGAEAFDEGAFRLSKSEAAGLDPQSRALLEQTAAALADAGGALRPKTAGVYVGCVWTEYLTLQQELGLNPSANSLTGSGLNFTSGRVSYTFGLQGPCVGLDTACSSSLVAAHLGHRGLLDGEVGEAVAGGTNLMLSATTGLHLARLGSLSSNGRSKTFDSTADGYGRGEACVMVVIRRPGDVINGRVWPPLALMHGSAYNQDGRSSGLTAPNGPAQTALVRSALGAAGAGPAAVGLVSLHGTGTPLGDPIEASALGQALAAGFEHTVTLGKNFFFFFFFLSLWKEISYLLFVCCPP
jgi:acyl transferase domain-containing protein